MKSLHAHITNTQAIRPVVLTVNEAAQFLACSTDTVLRMIHSNEVPAFLCGKTWRIDKAEMLNAMRDNAARRIAEIRNDN